MPVFTVFLDLSIALFAVAVWLGAAAAFDSEQVEPDEKSAFLWVVWPTILGAWTVAFLFGWAWREPDPADERISIGLLILVGVGGMIVMRAVLRAIYAVIQPNEIRAIATVGLIRRRIVVNDEFRRQADAKQIAAALAHEAAHARHRDPLRIWLAQLACDLQWPVAGATKRLNRWLLALEMRRDDEAIGAGASPVALAESILLAARIQGQDDQPAAACIVGDRSGFAHRVRRLMQEERTSRPARRNFQLTPSLTVATLLLAFVLGDYFGDAVLAFVPGVMR